MSRLPALLGALLFIFTPAALTAASDMSALEIMKAVDDRDDGDRMTQTMEMILVDRKGNKRRRTLANYSQDRGEDTYSIIFFITPADVKDSAFLTWDYDKDDKDDDQWLYLPALRKTKRIASGDKSGSFMGSDFSYSDMSTRPLDRYQYKIMKDVVINGHPAWQIESLPNPEEIEHTGYRRSILFVRKDNFVVIRAVHWKNKGGITKFLDIKKLEQIDGIWVPTEIQMTSRKGKEVRHRTVLFNLGTQFNQPMKDEWFTMGQLEKGRPVQP